VWIRGIGLGVILAHGSVWALNKNQSIEFLQSENRNASTDADAAFHNPAGLAFLPGDGFHFGAGTQVVIQDRTLVEDSPSLRFYGPGTYEGEIRVWSFPTLQAVYRKEDLAVYLHGGPLAGGGSGTYAQGLPMFDNLILGYMNEVAQATKAGVSALYTAGGAPGAEVTKNAEAGFLYERSLSFEGDEKTLGATLGAAYKVHDMVSVSAAYRFSHATSAYRGKASPTKFGIAFQGSDGIPGLIPPSTVDDTLTKYANLALASRWRDIEVDVEASGQSHGVVLGLDVMPHPDWNVGLRFEWNSTMELENTSSTIVAPDDLRPFLAAYEKGAKTNVTEPMVLAGGVSWKALEGLRLESSWTYAFFENVDRDGAEEDFRNSLFGGLGVRWQVHPKVETSVGFVHDWAFREDVARLETDFDMPTSYWGAGLGVQATDRLRVDLGAMLGVSEDQKGVSAASGAPQTMGQEHMNFGLGLSWSPGI
jgi:long-chain fatty acid transport protein